MNIKLVMMSVTILISNPLLAMESSECRHATALPLTTVADFDANGIVNGNDIAALANHIGKNKDYYALYDLNADGVLDSKDITLASKDLNKASSDADRDIASMYNRFSEFQPVRGDEALLSMGYAPIPVPLKGHGVHWLNVDGMASLMGLSHLTRKLLKA